MHIFLGLGAFTGIAFLIGVHLGRSIEAREWRMYADSALRKESNGNLYRITHAWKE